MRGITRVGVLALLSMTAAACGSANGQEAAGPGDANDVIAIGALLPLSGSASSSGEDMLHAAELAATDVNDRGGVLGKSIRIVPGDDACDAQTGTAAAQKLLVSDVVAVAGGYCSSAAIPASAVLAPEKIAFVSAAATNPVLTDRRLGTVFRTIGRDDQQGPFAARFLTGELKAKRIALLHDNTTYSKGLAEQVRTATEEIGTGSQVVLFDAITPGESDYTSTLTKIKSTNADVLYFAGYYAEGGLIVRQARSLGLTAALVGGDANQDLTLVKTAGDAAEGFIVTTAPLPAFLPGAAGFVERYTARFGQAPGPFSVYQYDAVMAIAQAIAAAGSSERADVVAALQKLTLSGLTGEISFDDKGDREKAIYVTAQVRDGMFAPHRRLDAGGNWIDG